MAMFYWLFVAVMGVSLASIFLMYTGVSLATTFFVTAGAFGALSIAGYTTKINMSGWGSFLMMAVFGLIIASVVNIFLGSSMLSLAVSALGVLIFSALIAYKTQWLKENLLSTGKQPGRSGHHDLLWRPDPLYQLYQPVPQPAAPDGQPSLRQD